jgi:hypothetical protein
LHSSHSPDGSKGAFRLPSCIHRKHTVRGSNFLRWHTPMCATVNCRRLQQKIKKAEISVSRLTPKEFKSRAGYKRAVVKKTFTNSRRCDIADRVEKIRQKKTQHHVKELRKKIKTTQHLPLRSTLDIYLGNGETGAWRCSLKKQLCLTTAPSICVEWFFSSWRSTKTTGAVQFVTRNTES